MLGFPKALAAVSNGIFGQGKGQIWLSDICCHGDEKSLLQCPHGKISGTQDCGHSDDVGVVCQEEDHASRGTFHFWKYHLISCGRKKEIA